MDAWTWPGPDLAHVPRGDRRRPAPWVTGGAAVPAIAYGALSAQLPSSARRSAASLAGSAM